MRGWLLLFFPMFLVTGCDIGPFYDNPYCGLEGDQNHLYCQMGEKIPFLRSGEEVQFVDLCQQESNETGILSTRLFQNVKQEGRYLAIGGYCPVRGVVESVAEAASLDGASFDGLLIQVFAEETSEVEPVLPDLRALGANVELYQLESR